MGFVPAEMRETKVKLALGYQQNKGLVDKDLTVERRLSLPQSIAVRSIKEIPTCW
jgi:hypothetical protein